MDFWSKGLGKRTVCLYLRDGAGSPRAGAGCTWRRMDEPMSWDYIMPLEASEFAEFMGLLREPEVASFLYHSPKRNAVYRTLVVDGLRLVLRLVAAIVRHPIGVEQRCRNRRSRTPASRAQGVHAERP